MTKLRRIVLSFACLSIACTLSGCCVTSFSSRKSCQTPDAACQNYEPIPQGIGPVEAPLLEPAPTPVPPSPASANRGFRGRSTSMIRQMGDSMRDTFTR